MSVVPDLSGRVEDVAPRLLGCVLSTSFGEETSVRLTEVEAYGGEDDAASHAYRGRTPRNGSMFGPPGTVYVYRSYGIHWCVNIATGPEGTGSAVLLRAGDIMSGQRLIQERRGRDDHLTDGPGKLTQALGITGDLDGTDVFGGPISLTCNGERWAYLATPRVGITKEVDRRWRFTIQHDGGSRPSRPAHVRASLD